MTQDASPPSKAAYHFRGEGTSAFQRFAWNAGRLISRIMGVLFFRLHVSGQNNIPRSGGVLMVTNHQSFLDPWLIGIAPSRQVHYMARDTLFNKTGGVHGFLHYLLELWNAFPVKRGSADLGAIRTAVERLNQGFLLNIFPEGTRSIDGTIGPVAPGMVLILNRTKSEVPILPTLIDGAYEAWPRSQKFPGILGTHPIRIRYGRPIPSSEWRALSPDALAIRIRQELVRLQRELNSPHAAASERRLTEDGSLAGTPRPKRLRQAATS